MKGVNVLFQARCLEEENESLEVQILELKERMGVEGEDSTAISTRGPADYSLEAVVERLRREKVQLRRLHIGYIILGVPDIGVK